MTLRDIAAQRRADVLRDVLLQSQDAEQSGGPVIRNPVPDWLRRENDSVLDSVPEKAAKAVLRFLGADDPNSQVLGLMAPVEVPGSLRALARPITKEVAKTMPLPELVDTRWHPIGGGKEMKTPLTEMRFNVESAPGARGHRVFEPAEMEGATIIPLTGDRARAQATLTQIGDVPFTNPVKLPGGPEFMLENPGSAWAMAQGQAKTLTNKVGNGRTFAVYMPGSHQMVDFSTTFTDALLEQIPAAPLTKKSIQSFDAAVRRLRPEWKGLANPEARAQLQKNGALRTAFADVMSLKQFQDAGFPDLATTRAAISEPALMNTPLLHGGYAIAELDGTMSRAAVPHPSYNTNIGGKYVGQFASDVPMKDLFPSFMRSRAGGDPNGHVRAFMLSHPTQQATATWVKNITKILANAPPRTVDYVKKYGVAAALSAGLISESQARQLGDQEER